MPLSNGSPVVPASNPFNPFGVNVTFSGRVLGINADYLVQKPEITGMHVVLGARGDITDTWGYSADVIYSEDVSDTTNYDTDLLLLQYALNGFGGPGCRIGLTGPVGEVAGQGNCVYFSPFGAQQLSNDPRTMYNLLQPKPSRRSRAWWYSRFYISASSPTLDCSIPSSNVCWRWLDIGPRTSRWVRRCWRRSYTWMVRAQ